MCYCLWETPRGRLQISSSLNQRGAPGGTRVIDLSTVPKRPSSAAVSGGVKEEHRGSGEALTAERIRLRVSRAPAGTALTVRPRHTESKALAGGSGSLQRHRHSQPPGGEDVLFTGQMTLPEVNADGCTRPFRSVRFAGLGGHHLDTAVAH